MAEQEQEEQHSESQCCAQKHKRTTDPSRATAQVETELAMIKRLKELQMHGVAFLGRF